ncbi:hypothetical protein [Intestinimonas timonensis]|uniref:hypothetical protein n=1 Tax=Intestinimonas timonensis TaxID=1689270 RepID=UPI0023F48B03|nr:hypothetical protein [Intestinimonas timonensis]
MKKRTIALLLLTALLGVLLTSCSEDKRNYYSPGYWRDSIFYDAFVDLRFTLPQGWEATSQEDLDAMSAEADKALDIQRGGTGEDPASVYHYELSAKDTETGNGILILVQSYSGNANDYIDGLKSGAELEGATYSVGSTSTVQLPGHAYLMVPLTMEGQDTPYQRQYLRKQGDYLINIMFFSTTEDEAAFSALEATLSEMDNA